MAKSRATFCCPGDYKKLLSYYAADFRLKKKYFLDCHLAGRKYHNADEVWDKLKVGTVLQLQRDLENRHDQAERRVRTCSHCEAQPIETGICPYSPIFFGE